MLHCAAGRALSSRPLHVKGKMQEGFGPMGDSCSNPGHYSQSIPVEVPHFNSDERANMLKNLTTLIKKPSQNKTEQLMSLGGGMMMLLLLRKGITRP